MNVRHLALGAAGALLMATLGQVMALPSWPEHIHLQSVGDKLRVDGRPTRIFTLHSPYPVATVSHDIQARWRTPLRISSSGRWQVLSSLSGERLVTIQLAPAPARGTQGLVAIAAPHTAPRPPQPTWLLPTGMRLHQWLDADDHGRHSRTLVLIGTTPVADQLEVMREHFRRHGYVPLGPRSLQLGDNSGSLLLTGPAGTVSVAASRRMGRTLVAVVTVRHP